MGKKFLGYVLILVTLISLIHFAAVAFHKNRTLVNVCQNNKWGTINLWNEKIIDYKYDFISQFVKDRAIVMNDSKYGVINKKDHIIVAVKYDMIFDYSEDLAATKSGKKFGYINTDGEVKIPFEYDFAEVFSDKLALVQKKNKWGYIDKNNKVVIPLKYKNAKNFNEGVTAVSEDGNKWSLINKKGEVVLKQKFDYISSYDSKEAVVCNKNSGDKLLCGVISVKNNSQIIPFKYRAINQKSEGYYAVKDQNEKWKFIDKKDVIKSKDYKLAYDFHKGLAIVCVEQEACGVINKKEKIKIPFEYEIVSPFYQGVVAAMKDGKWGFLNKNGKIVVPFEFDWTGLIF